MHAHAFNLGWVTVAWVGWLTFYPASLRLKNLKFSFAMLWSFSSDLGAKDCTRQGQSRSSEGKPQKQQMWTHRTSQSLTNS